MKKEVKDKTKKSNKKIWTYIKKCIPYFAKEKKADVIIGKFTQSPYCLDGYCIRKSTKNVIELLRKESPNEDPRMFKYFVFVCTDCKDEQELIKGLGF